MTNAPRNSRSASARVAIVALAAAAAGAVALWTLSVRRRERSAISDAPAAGIAPQPVTLFVSGDTAGWIVPCGCTSNQSGGLLRRGTLVRQLRDRGAIVVADAGGAAAGTSEYQRLKFKAILRGEMRMGLAAHNLGGPEAALGAEELRRIETELAAPFVSANLRDASGALVTAPCRIVDSAGQRIALVGVLSPKQKVAGCTVDEPRDAVLAALREYAGRYDRAVILAWLPEAGLRELAASLPEADAVIGGPTGQSLVPQSAGPTMIASATNKGKFAVCITIPPRERGSALSGEVVELTGRFSDDPEQMRNLQSFRGALAERDFPASETGLVALRRPDRAARDRVSGTESCARCHAGDAHVWQESAHAHAWETLRSEGAHVDPECQRCHTTGYGLPGGFETIAGGAARGGVGCESCHGPAEAHARQPGRKTLFDARDECRRCHDRENSPQFEFGEYWKRIVHGEPATADSRAPSNP